MMGVDVAIKTVGVLGCGLMGGGIAQACATAGYRTIVREVNETFLEGGLGRIRKRLDDGVSKGKVVADVRDKALGNLTGTVAFTDLAGCDLVIEAITESLEDKRALYVEVEKVVGEAAILASNTSSLCIAELAAASGRPDRFAGMHFFNPVPVMKLVEVIRGLSTSDETYRTVFEFAQGLGKEPVTVADRPGFIVNRLLIPYLLDAVRAYEQGLGSLEDIDKAMKLGCGHPMGPFALLDFIGLDTTFYIAKIMFEEFGTPTYAPPPLLKRMVLAGHLGKKSGQGFYTY
jgi:3-hydroxybutyryl-CoA dehydrogenase